VGRILDNTKAPTTTPPEVEITPPQTLQSVSKRSRKNRIEPISATLMIRNLGCRQHSEEIRIMAAFFNAANAVCAEDTALCHYWSARPSGKPSHCVRPVILQSPGGTVEFPA